MRRTLKFSPLLLTLALFASGLVMGILGLRVLSPDEKAELVAYLEVFMRGVHNPGLDPKAIFRLSLEQNARTALFIWAFGLAVIGAPLTCVLIFVRGFAAGFGAMFLLREVTSGGLTMFLSGMVPHNLIAIPALLSLSAMSISFSVALLRERPWNYGGLWKMVATYTWRFLMVAAGLFLASAVEAFVSPLLLSRSTGL
ncbi:MAG: stage II sporulation protein M [Bacillota bacterium]|jgi:stage II sporulation protein M|nr:stage II sporulation protein M [Candidatus Fermentithermobacillaceae bacterium]